MTIRVDIQVQGGEVRITLGGQPSSKSATGAILAEGNVGDSAGTKGGDGAVEDPGPGGGGPGSDVVVIGPIVVDRSVLGMPNSANAAGQGGDGAVEDPGPGGGGPGSGIVVIGPIVIGGQSRAAATAPSKAVAINP